MYEIDLKKVEKVIFTPVALNDTDLSIEVIEFGEANQHLFGLSKKNRTPSGAHTLLY